MVAKAIRLGERGDELLMLLYRWDGITAEQYRLLSPEISEESRKIGKKTSGNKYGRKLSSRVEDIRRWAREGKTDAEVAALLGISDASAVKRFRCRRGIELRGIA